jgi:hypothetical protein
MVGLNRDSMLLYLALAATVVGYFAAAEQTPDLWSFKEWMQFALVVISWLIGKLQTSPLPHSTFGDAKITREDYKP